MGIKCHFEHQCFTIQEIKQFNFILFFFDKFVSYIPFLE